MQLLTRARTGKLVIELTRHAVAMIYFHEDIHGHGKLVLKKSDEIIEFDDSQWLTSQITSAVRVLNIRSPLMATVCLPRSLASVHVLEFPSMGYPQLVSAIHLEMEAVYGEDLEEYVWDFTFVEADGSARLIASVVCIPQRTLSAIRVALDQAQIVVERITLSVLGYGSAATGNSLVHILAIRQNQLDFMICYRGLVLQSQTLTVNPEVACKFDQIIGILRRMNSSLPESLQILVPSSALLLANSNAIDPPDLPNEFESSLTRSCQAHEFAIEEFPASQLFTTSPPTNYAIDLAHPRRPALPPFSQRSKAAFFMALVLSAVAIYWALNQLEFFRISNHIKATQLRIEDSERKLAALDHQLEMAAIVNQWDESNVNWSDQVAAIGRQFSQADDCYLVRLQMDNQNAFERKPVTRLEGRAKTTQRILDLTRKLSADNPSLAVQPNGIEPNSVDPEFGSQFRVEISEADRQVPRETELIQDK